jgi:hypothetical protein
VVGKEIDIFDASGQIYQWTPEFHVRFSLDQLIYSLLTISQFKSDLRGFEKLHRGIRKDYVEGKPRYLSDPGSSCIKVTTYADYKRMSTKAVQDVLRKQHIVITEFPIELVVPTDDVVFDEAGLQLLKNLEANIVFQGKVQGKIVTTDHDRLTLSDSRRPVDPCRR